MNPTFTSKQVRGQTPKLKLSNRKIGKSPAFDSLLKETISYQNKFTDKQTVKT